MTGEQNRRRAPAPQTSRSDKIKSSSRKRKRKNHKKNGFIYLVLILLVIAAGVGVSFTVIFNTENIAVENPAVRYSDEAIIKASGISVGDNMPGMNVNRIARDIEKKLPYIGGVRIKRGIDSTVTISVEYTRAALAVETVSGYVILNASGKVLEKGVGEPADYVAEVIGAEIESAETGETVVFTDDDMFTYITGLASDFENAGYRNVTQLDFTDLQNIRAEIDYRVSVKLGNITKAASKLRFGKAVIDENLGSASSGRLIVDLTQDGTAFVRSEENIAAAQKSPEENENPADEQESAGNAASSENAEGEETTVDQAAEAAETTSGFGAVG